jgi:hypothetical protein
LRIDICNIRVQSLRYIQHPDLLLQHLKHSYETFETLETCACNMVEPRAGWFQSLGSEPVPREHHHATTIISSTKLGSIGRAARATGGSERRRMGVWQQRGVQTRRPPRWRRLATATRWMRPQRSYACDSGEKKCRCVFFLRNHIVLKGGEEEACWARWLSRPRNEPSGRNTPRLTPVC